jgi:hypothetical protein
MQKMKNAIQFFSAVIIRKTGASQLDAEQGDQIFAHWVTVYHGQVLKL